MKANAIVEIDTRFWRAGLQHAAPRHGGRLDRTPTAPANVKFSEYDPAMLAFHEAHVEAVEEGTHQVSVENQAGLPHRLRHRAER